MILFTLIIILLTIVTILLCIFYNMPDIFIAIASYLLTISISFIAAWLIIVIVNFAYIFFELIT